MANVSVVHDQLNYIGIFSKPAFELWGKGEKIYRGLFTALEPYGITLSNIHNSSASLDPSDHEVRFWANLQIRPCREALGASIDGRSFAPCD